MKNKISLIALTLGVMLVINACQTPEERAQEMNTMDTSVNDATISAMPDTATTVATDNRVLPGTTSASDITAKTKKGKATVVMLAAQNTKGKMEADKDGIYARAEVMPAYPGGQRSLEKFVEDNLQYPQDALDNGIEGRVVISFDVDETGKIYRPMIVSDKLGHGLEDEALRVVKAMPQWNPGKIKGQNVKTKFTLPIVYQLEQ
ncbi:hypothetical protein BH10BAC2_BH10BAC2_41670 [soil metagenome]